MNSVTIEGISKNFNHLKAVDNLSLNIEEGSLFGLLGPNGAGKTTIIRMILNIILPDIGKIALFGRPLNEEAKNHIGYLPEERGLYSKMKISDMLLFLAAIKGVKPAEARKAMDYWLEQLGLLEWKDKKVQDLSKGMQQKLQFIATIQHSPDLIILDEPFFGLDPINANLLKDIILELNEEGRTIILSTHMMEKVEKLCQNICLINKGREVLNGSLKEIKKKYGKNSVIISFDGKDDFLKNNPEIEKMDRYSTYVEVRLAKGADTQKLLARAMQQAAINRFEVVEPSLTEIFIELVEGEK